MVHVYAEQAQSDKATNETNSTWNIHSFSVTTSKLDIKNYAYVQKFKMSSYDQMMQFTSIISNSNLHYFSQ